MREETIRALPLVLSFMLLVATVGWPAAISMSNKGGLTAVRVVVDRIEGNKAVLLVGSEEALLIVSVSELPEGATEGTIMTLRFEIDEQATQRTKEQIAKRIEALKKRR